MPKEDRKITKSMPSTILKSPVSAQFCLFILPFPHYTSDPFHFSSCEFMNLKKNMRTSCVINLILFVFHLSTVKLGMLSYLIAGTESDVENLDGQFHSCTSVCHQLVGHSPES